MTLPLLKGGAGGSGGRTVISSATTFYVNNVTGNNATARDNDITKPWRTIQAAVDHICKDLFLNPGNGSIIVQLQTTGVNYDECVELRSWQGELGEFSLYLGAPMILGDTSNRTAVKVAPTTNPNFLSSIFIATGYNAYWAVGCIDIDGTGVQASSPGHFGARNHAALFVISPSLGPCAGIYFTAFNNGYIKVVHNIGSDNSPSRIYGGNLASNPAPYFGYAIDHSAVWIDTDFFVATSMNFGFGIAAEQESRIWYGHNVAFTYDVGVTTTGQRFFLRENSFGYSEPFQSTILGNSAGQVASNSLFDVFQFNVGATLGTTLAALVAEVIPAFGQCVVITDCNTTTLGGVVAGGGATIAVVWYDGANWRLALPLAAVGGSSITVNSTPIVSGTAKHVAYETTGNLFGEAANFTIESGNPNVTAGNFYSYDSTNILMADVAKSNWWLGFSGNLTASGTGNIGIGDAAIGALTSGGNNVAIGYHAATGLTSGSNVLAIGRGVMQTNTITGSNVVGIGTFSLQSLSSGADNVGIGTNSLQSLTTANKNIGIGSSALVALVTGDNNTGIGNAALTSTNGGADNIGIGQNAFNNNVTGGGNVGIGSQIGFFVTGDRNTFIGFRSGTNTTTGTQNIDIGATGAASTRGPTTGGSNINIGWDTGLASNTASQQLTIGNLIYGTTLDGTGTTISSGSIGIGVKAPAQKLDVNGGIKQSQAAALIHTGVALTNGAGTGSGVTFTNAPGASGATGNPTKWIPIDDNGTTRYVPAF